VRTIGFHGWQAVELDNGFATVVAVPELGGRIMVYALGGKSPLWLNEALLGKRFSAEEHMGDGSLASWKNYGGDKTWPAPQGWEHEGQWHGPPDPVLDTGRYEVIHLESSTGTATVRMRSAPDPRTGVQLVRHLTLAAGTIQLRLKLEMTNVSDRPRTWSISDVAQLDTSRRTPEGDLTFSDDALLYIPLNPHSRFPQGYNVMYGAHDNPQWQLDRHPGMLVAQYQFRLGKIGVDSTAGWVAFAQGTTGLVFCEHFSYQRDATYPDGGVSVECWTTGEGEIVGGVDFGRERLFFMESEILGPLRTLAPGETQHLDIDFHLARCPAPVVAVSDLGCVSAPLTAAHTDRLPLQGVFGVFAAGQVELVWYDHRGEERAAERIGAADPRVPLMIEHASDPPEDAVRAELRLVEAGGTTGSLARVEVQRTT